MIPKGVFLFGTPFREQIDFFRKKLNLPTERWDDIMQQAHDRAFVVAGAMKADLLDDLQQTVFSRIADGRGIEAFRKDFRSIVQRHGWHGWTGEGTAAGEAWRTKVIYQTNMATSYAAGRYRQLTDPELLAILPYWKYVHADGVANPRLRHLAWNGLILPWNHPFWKTHWGPNGWGCRCHVVPVDRAAYDKAKAKGLGEAPPGWDVIDPKTGAQIGITKGFDYAPGASVASSFKDFIDQKLIRLNAPIGAAMWDTLAPLLAEEQRQAVAALVDTLHASMRVVGNAALAHVVSPVTVADLASRGIAMESAGVWLRDEELLPALRDAKKDRGTALPIEAWRDLPKHLASATPLIDTQDSALVYAFELSDFMGKVLVRVNYADKIVQKNKRNQLNSNYVRTAAFVNRKDIENGTQYVPLKK